MKTFLKLVFTISLIINIYFLYHIYISYKFINQQANSPFFVKNISKKDGTAYLMNRIKNEEPKLAFKQYYFINIWNMLCGPCIKEMPTLDSLAGNVSRKDIGFIFLTENGEKVVSEFLKRKKIKENNFTYINDGNDYISAVLNEKGLKNHAYPIQLIIDNKGDIKYFEGDAIESANDTTLINFMNRLP